VFPSITGSEAEAFGVRFLDHVRVHRIDINKTLAMEGVVRDLRRKMESVARNMQPSFFVVQLDLRRPEEFGVRFKGRPVLDIHLNGIHHPVT
jgi:hypothetical protein